MLAIALAVKETSYYMWTEGLSGKRGEIMYNNTWDGRVLLRLHPRPRSIPHLSLRLPSPCTPYPRIAFLRLLSRSSNPIFDPKHAVHYPLHPLPPRHSLPRRQCRHLFRRQPRRRSCNAHLNPRLTRQRRPQSLQQHRQQPQRRHPGHRLHFQHRDRRYQLRPRQPLRHPRRDPRPLLRPERRRRLRDLLSSPNFCGRGYRRRPHRHRRRRRHQPRSSRLRYRQPRAGRRHRHRCRRALQRDRRQHPHRRNRVRAREPKRCAGGREPRSQRRQSHHRDGAVRAGVQHAGGGSAGRAGEHREPRCAYAHGGAERRGLELYQQGCEWDEDRGAEPDDLDLQGRGGEHNCGSGGAGRGFGVGGLGFAIGGRKKIECLECGRPRAVGGALCRIMDGMALLDG